MAAISITAANVLPSASAVINRSQNAGATITAGQAVYADANGVWQLTDADLSATAAACDGIALSSASTGQPLAVCTSDPAFTLGGTVAAGDTVWTSPTAGGVTKTIADLVTGVRTVVLGVAISATQINLNITRSGVTHA